MQAFFDAARKWNIKLVLRFAYQYDLKIDENTKKLLEDNYYLIENLNKFKVDEENKKFLKMKERKNGTN